MDKEETKTVTERPAKAAAPAVHAPLTAAHEPRNFLVAFLLTTTLGVLGLRHFYLGDKRLGWIRTGLFAGGYVWLILMSMLGQNLLSGIGFLAVAVASVWSLVDFFYVYNAVKVDADGQPVVATHRDKRWARALYLGAIAMFVLSFVLMIVGGVYIEKALKGNPSLYRDSSLQAPGQQDEYSDFLRELDAQSSEAPSY